jgi:hypothetical protein
MVASETPNIAAIVKPAGREGRLIEFLLFAPPSYSAVAWGSACSAPRAAHGLRYESAKHLGLPGAGLHLFLRKTALQSQDVLQILSFGQLVS